LKTISAHDEIGSPSAAWSCEKFSTRHAIGSDEPLKIDAAERNAFANPPTATARREPAAPAAAGALKQKPPKAQTKMKKD
jgi:hypothetical protein